MEITDRTLLNRTATVGGDVLVRVDLSNVAPARGRITLNLTANRTLVAQRTVAVGMDTRRTIYLGTTFESPGRYALRLNDVPVGNVSVSAAGTETRGTETAPATATPSPVATQDAGGAGRPSATAAPDPPGATPTVTAPLDPDGVSADEVALAAGLALLLLYGVGVVVYVLRERPPDRLG